MAQHGGVTARFGAGIPATGPRLGARLLAGSALAAALLLLTPADGQAFVCQNVGAGVLPGNDGGSPGNTACGHDAQAAGGTNTAIGTYANATGNLAGNVAIGGGGIVPNGPQAWGNNSANVALGIAANASGNNSRNIASGGFSKASGAGSNNIATGQYADASGDGTGNIAIGGDLDGDLLGARAANNSVAIGGDSVATGNRASAFGSGAQALGAGSVAIGENAQATQDGAVAIGANTQATHANAAAFGNGAVTTRTNQQVYGNASHTHTMAGITSAASRAAQTGPTQIVTSDSDGNLATSTLADLGLASNADIAGMNARIADLDNRTGKAITGVAMAFAMAGVPTLMPHERMAMTFNMGTYQGAQGFAVNAAWRITDNVQFNGGIGYGPDQRIVGGRAGLRVAW